ncbi:MAG: ATP-grasp domain-containing protein [Candidatus Bathyarchaeota archaeon]|nr:ATP-grasp domain-containing protein [Candidatus Bathyarchaeota archaeon]
MNLLIFEYVSGGGYANMKLSSSILSEGYGMLRSLISDCKAAGHNVTTLLDSRLKKFNPPNEADQIVSVPSPHELSAKLRELSSVADAVYVIAPESGQVLEKLVENIETSGGTSLNCEIDAIKRVSNKMTTYETLERKGVKVPETVLLDIHEKTGNIKRLTKELGYPLVFKPLDGVSCSGLSLVKDENKIAGAVKKVARESISKHFIAQKLIRGKAASACVISTGDKALSVTLNRQLVTLGSPDEESGYYGGVVPLDHSLEKEALRAAQRVAEAVSGLKGYVGVDIILANEGPVVIEVNPRLTTSYVGLKRVVNLNPAQAIVDAVIRRKLPKNMQNRGYAFFSKVEVPSRRQIIAETYKLKDVISPPFPIEGNKSAYALLATVSTSPKGAESAFYRAKKRLLNLYRGD